MVGCISGSAARLVGDAERDGDARYLIQDQRFLVLVLLGAAVR
jgi:hypothetical protein